MEKATILGVIIGFGAILLGNVLEGGHTSSLVQMTALLIVLGGTAGAVMVSNPGRDLNRGLALFKEAFKSKQSDTVIKGKVDEIIECVKIVRKESLVSLEKKIPSLQDPFLSSIVKNLADGVDLQLIREIHELQIESEEGDNLAAAKIWVDAGGFSPTIGIIGAVLGLIHVMGNLSDTTKLGAGIAVAFVATVYGVSFANLLFLPIGNKLKKMIFEESKRKRALLEGALLIQSMLNPKVIEQKIYAGLSLGNKR